MTIFRKRTLGLSLGIAALAFLALVLPDKNSDVILVAAVGLTSLVILRAIEHNARISRRILKSDNRISNDLQNAKLELTIIVNTLSEIAKVAEHNLDSRTSSDRDADQFSEVDGTEQRQLLVEIQNYMERVSDAQENAAKNLQKLIRLSESNQSLTEALNKSQHNNEMRLRQIGTLALASKETSIRIANSLQRDSTIASVIQRSSFEVTNRILLDLRSLVSEISSLNHRRENENDFTFEEQRKTESGEA